MKSKPLNRTRRTKLPATPDENDFPVLDAWAKKLKLEDGRPLTVAQRREDRLARRAGRPAKPDSANAKRVMRKRSASGRRK